ncbi:MAG: hypothetical protein JWM10_1780 [Myxococcaceae bacterium]|nr:hypothetical protein [Myxococcaceae bacterium]
MTTRTTAPSPAAASPSRWNPDAIVERFRRAQRGAAPVEVSPPEASVETPDGDPPTPGAEHAAPPITPEDVARYAERAAAVGSVAGGAGAAYGGFLLGAAIGSVVPGVGTVVGAAAGSVAGVLGGSAAGRRLSRLIFR